MKSKSNQVCAEFPLTPIQYLIWFRVVLLVLVLAGSGIPCLAQAETNASALLIIAHGASRGNWNQRVVQLVNGVPWRGPKEVAFLSGDEERTLERVAARLDQPGVRQITVVPLFVSSFSGHFEEIRYYTGMTTALPDHAEHPPLQTKAPLVMTSAMDSHPLVSRILGEQLKPRLCEATRQSVVLVAHGPNEQHENEQWLALLTTHARRLKEQFGLHRAEGVTLRDDAPEAVRNAATEKLRAKVRAAAADSQVLVLPVLISVGHVQEAIRKRLDGVDCTVLDGGLVNHPLAAEWIGQQAAEAVNAAARQASHQAPPTR